eukprot:TRINITY_DN5120_c0_g1_i3.p1 TRINITY_DN5120_c0_g1~~TRINITY_DN5120_c0_g1_i3.p1  ORF type:complete len:108 (+),score=15.70 TRINITY_DN5120_c0_g1_i3:266-589(+)
MSEPPSSPPQGFKQCRKSERGEKGRKFLVARPGVNRSITSTRGSSPDCTKLRFAEMIYIIATTPVYPTILSKVVDTAENDHLAKALVRPSLCLLFAAHLLELSNRSH